MINLAHSGRIEWEEWRFWLLWALHEYHDEISSVDQLLTCVFTRAILPIQIHLLAEAKANLIFNVVPRLTKWSTRGRAAAAFMQDWTWSKQTDRLLDALDPVI